MVGVWTELRADSAKRDLGALASPVLRVDEVHAAAIDIVGRVVPSDATCWATVDPDTMLLTGSLTVAFSPSPEQEARFVELEYGGTDANSFATLARQRTPVARLSDLPHREVVRSQRLHEVYRPLGLAHEARVAFTVDGACWGVAGLLREPSSADFDDRELDFLAAVAPLVATATRVALRHATQEPAREPGPAVIVVDRKGQVQASTPAAQLWAAALDRTDGIAVALRAVATAAANGEANATVRLRDDSGRWVVLHASPLVGGTASDQIVVTVESALASDVTRLLLAAYGLSPRERDVSVEVLAGASTGEIAARLFISANTVQDHLKSIFAKVGVRSRRELVAHLT
jgi:DNA-binding CsgD family transcriptional regulator